MIASPRPSGPPSRRHGTRRPSERSGRAASGRYWLSLILILGLLATSLAALGHTHDGLPTADNTCAHCLHLSHHQATPTSPVRMTAPVWTRLPIAQCPAVAPPFFQGCTARARAPPHLG